MDARTAEPSAWDAYIDALMRIEAPGVVFWVRPAPIESTTGEYPDPEGRPIYVLTAHNPGGQVVPDAENALAEARLTAELERQGLTWWPAAGGDPTWTHVEPGAALIDVAENDAIALGAEFGQEAIFMLTPADCPAWKQAASYPLSRCWYGSAWLWMLTSSWR